MNRQHITYYSLYIRRGIQSEKPTSKSGRDTGLFLKDMEELDNSLYAAGSEKGLDTHHQSVYHLAASNGTWKTHDHVSKAKNAMDIECPTPSQTPSISFIVPQCTCAVSNSCGHKLHVLRRHPNHFSSLLNSSRP